MANQSGLVVGSSDSGTAAAARVIIPAPGPGLMNTFKQLIIRIQTNNGRRRLPAIDAMARRYAADDTEYTTPLTDSRIYVAGPRQRFIDFTRVYEPYRTLNGASSLNNTSIVLELDQKTRATDRQQILLFFETISSERLT